MLGAAVGAGIKSQRKQQPETTGERKRRLTRRIQGSNLFVSRATGRRGGRDGIAGEARRHSKGESGKRSSLKKEVTAGT